MDEFEHGDRLTVMDAMSASALKPSPRRLVSKFIPFKAPPSKHGFTNKFTTFNKFQDNYCLTSNWLL